MTYLQLKYGQLKYINLPVCKSQNNLTFQMNLFYWDSTFFVTGRLIMMHHHHPAHAKSKCTLTWRGHLPPSYSTQNNVLFNLWISQSVADRCSQGLCEWCWTGRRVDSQSGHRRVLQAGVAVGALVMIVRTHVPMQCAGQSLQTRRSHGRWAIQGQTAVHHRCLRRNNVLRPRNITPISQTRCLKRLMSC